MKRRTFKRLCTMCLAFVAALTMGMSTLMQLHRIREM